MMIKQSFPARLSLNVIMLTSILFIATIATASYSSHKILAEEAQTSSEHLLASAIKDIEKSLGNVESSIQSVAWLVDENNTDKEYLYHIVEKIVAENDNIIGSTVAFAPEYFAGEHFFSPYAYYENGRIYTKQLGTDKYDYFSMEWYRDAADSGKPHWSEPYYDEGGADTMMSTYSYPLKDSSGRTYAVITADISLKWLNELLLSIKPYPNSYVILVSAEGELINVDNFHVKEGNLFSWADSVKDERFLKISRDMAAGRKGLGRFFSGTELAFAVYDSLSNGWSAAMLCRYRDVLVRTSRMHIILIMIGLFGLLILFGVCYAIIRKLTKPLTEFTKSALNIAKGNFSTELPEIKSEDEIRQLRDSFDYMQKSLVTYINDLKESNDKNARFEYDLNIARRIQMGMLPHDFPREGSVDLHALLHPAKEVGGDLYDFYIKNDTLFFAIGDVSGKGLPASLFMAITRAAFRFISGLSQDMGQVIRKLNDSISDGNVSGMFVTLFAGRIDLKTGEMTYCNGGHNPIIINPAKGEPYYLQAKPNMALGVFPGFEYEAQSIRLEPGTEIVLYTDGVTEAEKADKSQYGERKLLEWVVSRSRHNSAMDDCEGLMQEIHTFADGNPQNDDITIMTIKIK